MSQQFKRKASLLVVKPSVKVDLLPLNLQEEAIDLSEMHFQFSTKNQDEEGPANCSVRVFNLSQSTVEKLIKYDYSRVIVQAGYEGQFGVIFDGNIKQFRTGRVSAVDTYLDILAADGDLGYNFAVSNATVAAGSSPAQRRDAIMQSFDKYGITMGKDLSETGGTLPRGKVLFGMGRTLMRDEVESRGATWSIQNGKVNIIPLDGYLPGEAVRLTTLTGLVGIPEQTQDGIKVRCLLNPKIVVGGRIQLDNKSINQTIQQDPQAAPIPFNQWANPQFLAKTANDGFYRVYVAEHEGDTRGQAWYSDLVCLAIDSSSGKVKPYG